MTDPEPNAAPELKSALPWWLVPLMVAVGGAYLWTQSKPREANPVAVTEHEVAVTDANAEAVTAKGVALLDFSASWCPPCRQMAPIVGDIAADYEGRIAVGVVDVDDAATQALQTRFGVNGIPHFVVLADGKSVATFTGAVPESDLRTAIDAAVAGAATR